MKWSLNFSIRGIFTCSFTSYIHTFNLRQLNIHMSSKEDTLNQLELQRKSLIWVTEKPRQFCTEEAPLALKKVISLTCKRGATKNWKKKKLGFSPNWPPYLAFLISSMLFLSRFINLSFMEISTKFWIWVGGVE